MMLKTLERKLLNVYVKTTLRKLSNKPVEKINDSLMTTPKKFKPKVRGLVLGAYEGHTIHLTPAAEEFDTKCNGNLLKQIRLATGGTMKENRSYTFYNMNGFQRVVVVSIPKNFKHTHIENHNQYKESIREAAGRGCNVLKQNEVTDMHVDCFSDAEAAAEGSFLSTYRFQEFKKKKEAAICINLFESSDADCGEWFDGRIKANAQNLARRLMETPSNVLTPTEFANCTEKLLNRTNFSVTIHDEEWAKKEKMFSFLSVGNGSVEDSKFLEIHYGNTDDKPIVLIGKELSINPIRNMSKKMAAGNNAFWCLVSLGVCFDSGGISLKPALNMGNMKGDMGGAAVIVAALWALSSLDVGINIVALLPLVENMPSASATKPGDVVFAANGKSISIDNTDAEGRLILADALSYSKKFNPRFILDFATLTGAIRVSLGDGACGVFSNSNRLYKHLETAAFESGDRVWRMPLWNVYTKKITHSSHVDVSNVSKDAYGGACTAAAFLREFVPEETQWMHIDMAGVYGSVGNTDYLRGKHMTGRPTRTLIEFLVEQAKIQQQQQKEEELNNC